MDMARCPDCGSWDVYDMDMTSYRCMECGIEFKHPPSDEVPA